MPFYVERKAIRKVPGTVIKAVPIPKPGMTQGFGSREQVGEICEKAGYKSVLLVTDETLFGLGLHEKVVSSLQSKGIGYTLFHSINSEPNVDIVKEGRQAAIDCNADCIVALGGGSVMDSSKIIAASASIVRRIFLMVKDIVSYQNLLFKFCWRVGCGVVGS